MKISRGVKKAFQSGAAWGLGCAAAMLAVDLLGAGLGAAYEGVKAYKEKKKLQTAAREQSREPARAQV